MSSTVLKHTPKLIFVLAVLLLHSTAFAEDEYSFDMSQYEKSPYDFDGYVEFRVERYNLDPDAALYKLAYPGASQGDLLTRYVGLAQLEGRFRKDDYKAYVRLNPQAYTDDNTSDSEITTHEAYLSWQAQSSLSVDIGKRLMKWGKGYAWNPVGFVERPKDPNDPDLAREGYSVLTADWITSLEGDLRTITLSPVYLPVRTHINPDYGIVGNNFAFKLYLLYKDTDIDVMYLGNASRSSRLGVDFSRNVLTNFEIHGEWAQFNNVDTYTLNASNALVATQSNAQSWLLGIRYLSERETTYILEFYRNGLGIDHDQSTAFYKLVEDIPNQADPALALQQAISISKKGFATQSGMRRYLYARISQKDPFDYLYFTPAITSIMNLQDHSYNLAPEMLYSGITNLELRFRVNVLQGAQYSEFGEKANDSKWEFRLRYAF